MLKNLQIVGFRGIPKLSFESLARVNLIVGKNNAGKTAVLEAIELLCLREHEAWIRSPLRRGELLSRFEEFERALEIRHLFNGRTVTSGSSFEVTAQTDGRPNVPKDFWIHGLIIGDGESSVLRDSPGDSMPAPRHSAFRISRAAFEPDELISISSDGWTWVDRYTAVPCKKEPTGGFPVVYISSDSLSGDELLALWDHAQFEEKTEPILQLLRQIFPGFVKIGPLGSETGRVRGNSFSVRLEGDNDTYPIGSLGDGVRRLFAVLLAISESEGGCVLIDDIDTGLHHSVMLEMWRAVLKLSNQLNIQVFATTHSSDCWRSLGYLCASDPEISRQVSVHRLERGLDRTILYTPEQLAVAAERDIEIR